MRWNVFCVSRWHSNLLVYSGTDILWKFDVVYRRCNLFCVNRWHWNRYYTINQGTEKRRNTKLKLSTRTMGILVCLGTDILWKFDGVYRRWNVFCVNCWHSNRYYTINQATEKLRDTKLKLSTQTTGNLLCLEADIIVEIRGSVYALKRILRQPLTLKPILHNKSGNRET